MVNPVTRELYAASALKKVRGLDTEGDIPLATEIASVRKQLGLATDGIVTASPFKKALKTMAGLLIDENIAATYPHLAAKLDAHRVDTNRMLRKVAYALSRTEEVALPEDLIPRPTQVRFMTKMRTYFSYNKEGDEDTDDDGQELRRTGFAKYPTGLGKTIMIALTIRALVHHHEDADILVLSPRGEINRQNEDKIRRYQETDVVVKDIDDINSGETVDATIATIQMAALDLNKAPSKRKLKQHYHFIVLDECHRAFGEQMITLLRSQYPDSIIIGFSATPYVGSSKNTASMHSAFEFFEGEIDSKTLMEACSEGDLPPIRAKRVVIREEMGNVICDEDIMEYINLPARTSAAIKIAKEQIPKNEKGIIFCEGVQHSKETATALQEAGVKAVHLDGTSTEAEKIAARTELANGKIQFICNSDLLIEGFDEATLKHAIILRPTFSLWMYEQMIGRVCRIDENDPKKVATIWDVVGQHSGQCTIHGLGCFYGNLKEQFKNGEIVFGPANRVGETDPEKTIPNKGNPITKGAQHESQEVFIQDVVTLEEIAQIKIPRDVYYYSNPEWVRNDLLEAAKSNNCKEPASLSVDMHNAYFACNNREWNVTLQQYINGAIAAIKKASGEDKTKTQMLEELKDLAGFERGVEGDFPLANFNNQTKIKEALIEFTRVYEVGNPGHLKLNSAENHPHASPLIWGVRMNLRRFLRIASEHLGIQGLTSTLEELKKRAGFTHIVTQAKGEYFNNTERIRTDLIAFVAAVGKTLESIAEVNLTTTIRLETNEELSLGTYLNRWAKAKLQKDKYGCYPAPNILRDKIMEKLGIAPTKKAAPKAQEERPPKHHRPDDQFAYIEAGSRLNELNSYYQNDDNVRRDLGRIATALKITVEDLSSNIQQYLSKEPIQWGNGLTTTIAVYLRALATARSIQATGVDVLRIIAAQLLHKPRTTEPIGTPLEMDGDYFEDNAKTDLEKYATQAGISNIGNLNISNPAHLQARICCASNIELTLQEYVLRFAETDQKIKNNLRLAWPKLKELL